MIDLNDIDTEGTDGVDTVADLIFDRITDQLHNDDELAGKLATSEMPSSDRVHFHFADGRTITVHIEISPKVI